MRYGDRKRADLSLQDSVDYLMTRLFAWALQDLTVLI